MFGFEPIPTNNKRIVPFVVRQRSERKKLTKDDIPFGLRLFFCLYIPRGYAALAGSPMLNKIASAIVTVFTK
ncbi:hypothetical protein KAI78_09550 [bacterium]|nr:hypothetical protein [bacterium]